MKPSENNSGILKYKSKIKKLIAFMGRDVCRLLVLSTLTGVIWFAIDSSFIYVIQAFLKALNLIESKDTFLPEFYPTGVTAGVLSLAGFGFMRSVAIIFKEYSVQSAYQAFLRIQRERILDYSLSQTSEVPTHDVLTIFNDRVGAAASVVNSLASLITTFVSSTLFFVLGLRLAPYELFIGLFSLFLMTYPFSFLNRWIIELGRKLRADTAKTTEILILGLKNNFLLKLYDLTGIEILKGKKVIASYEFLYKKYILISTSKLVFPQFAGTLVMSLVCFISIEYIKTPSIKLVSFIYIFMRLAQGISECVGALSLVRLHWGSFEELYNWHVRRNAYIDVVSEQKKSFLEFPKTEEINIEVSDMHFGYDASNELFNGLNLRLSKREILLLKGPSGCGKSTLLTLLLGLQVPTRGTVHVNGLRVDYVREGLAEYISYVGPEPYMIQGTIRHNLLYANSRSDVTDEMIFQALSRSKLTNLVESSESGVDRELRETTELSTGQKQRMALARALLRKPKLLVLDEATANLDLDTELEIVEMIKSISKEMTIIIVSHKDSFDQVATKTLDLSR